MIQRIQSIFLLIIAVCMVAMLFVPVWVKGDLETERLVVLNAFELVYQDLSGVEPEVIETKSVIYISLIAIVAAGVALFSIFQYKNRLMQMKLGLLNSVLIAGLAVVSLIVAGNADTFMPEYPKEFKLGSLLPLIALIFNSLANRFIRRDEKLVRDSDRMR